MTQIEVLYKLTKHMWKVYSVRPLYINSYEEDGYVLTLQFGLSNTISLIGEIYEDGMLVWLVHDDLGKTTIKSGDTMNCDFELMDICLVDNI